MDRYRNCRRPIVLGPEMQKLIIGKLKQGWSAEQIAHRLRLETGEGPSHQSIYNFLGRKKEFAIYLKRGRQRGVGRYSQRRTYVKKNKLNIKDRPKVANKRARLGDWERDTMHTKHGKQLLVCCDRKSRLVKIARVETRTNLEINNLTLKLIAQTKRAPRSITNDNGADF